MTCKALPYSGIVAVAALGATFIAATPAESNPVTERAKVVATEDGLAVDSGGLDLVPKLHPDRNLGGPSKGFTKSAKSQLPSGSMRDFALIGPDGSVRDVVIDRTVTSGSTKKARVGWVRTKGSIGIEWPQRGDISHWEVTSPDGSSTNVRNKSSFVDLTTPESGTYTISGESTGDGDDVSLILTIPDATASPVMKAQSGTSTATNAQAGIEGQWRGIFWDSFIEEEFVKAKYLGIDVCSERDEYIYYGGDGRGFADSVEGVVTPSGEPDFRLGSGVASMFSFTDGWINPQIYDNLVAKQTGETTAYNADKELIATAQADAEEAVTLIDGDSIVLPPRLGDIGYATRSVEMEASDPLCNPRGPIVDEPPAINVEYTYEHTSNGYVHVEATHDKAPMHELFWAASDNEGDPSKSNGCLYRYENRGLEKLAPVFGRVDVTVDFNPDEMTPDCVLDAK